MKKIFGGLVGLCLFLSLGCSTVDRPRSSGIEKYLDSDKMIPTHPEEGIKTNQ